LVSLPSPKRRLESWALIFFNTFNFTTLPLLAFGDFERRLGLRGDFARRFGLRLRFGDFVRFGLRVRFGDFVRRFGARFGDRVRFGDLDFDGLRFLRERRFGARLLGLGERRFGVRFGDRVRFGDLDFDGLRFLRERRFGARLLGLGERLFLFGRLGGARLLGLGERFPRARRLDFGDGERATDRDPRRDRFFFAGDGEAFFFPLFGDFVRRFGALRDGLDDGERRLLRFFCFFGVEEDRENDTFFSSRMDKAIFSPSELYAISNEHGVSVFRREPSAH